MIEVKNLTKYYGKGESRFKVLDNINLKIAQGDFAVILGASFTLLLLLTLII